MYRFFRTLFCNCLAAEEKRDILPKKSCILAMPYTSSHFMTDATRLYQPLLQVFVPVGPRKIFYIFHSVFCKHFLLFTISTEAVIIA